uniref:Uncharacterized protein n=1 Tax=Rousettus aegyptiacus TaxID=9407 RepID=A0A7J8ILN3_ROUAE|nr:hypothetical protein HJG63_010673 [Rousettus aegyptiacus]
MQNRAHPLPTVPHPHKTQFDASTSSSFGPLSKLEVGSNFEIVVIREVIYTQNYVCGGKREDKMPHVLFMVCYLTYMIFLPWYPFFLKSCSGGKHISLARFGDSLLCLSEKSVRLPDMFGYSFLF